MCTQKASRSNPLGMSSCDLSFTFSQQRKKKTQNSSKDLWWDSAISKRHSQTHLIQENWNFKHFPILPITDCSGGLWDSPGVNPRGPAAVWQLDRCAAASPSMFSLLSLCPAWGIKQSLSSDGAFKTPFPMCCQGYRPLARNRASEGLFMPIWFLLSYIRGQGRDRALFLSSKSILYGTQSSKVKPASAFMEHCAVKNEGSCFSPFKDVW